MSNQHEQACFSRALLHAEINAPALALIENVGIGPERGLAVYQYAYIARLVEALGFEYPVLLKCAGDEAFAALARRYLAARPSTHWSLATLGLGFPAYLRLEGLLQPWWVDLAELEMAQALAFVAPDQTPLHADALAHLSPENWACNILLPVDSLRLVEAPPIALRALREPGPDLVMSDAEHGLRVNCAIWRQGLDVQWRSVGSGEATGLQALLKRSSLADLLMDLHEAGLELSDSVAMIKGWCVAGMIHALGVQEAS